MLMVKGGFKLNKGLIFGLGLGIGGGIGTGVTILVLKRKINRQKDEEIDEVRAYYKEKCQNCDKKAVTLESTEPEKVAKKAEKQEEKEASLTEKVGLAEKNTADIGRKGITNSSIDYTKFAKNCEKYTGKTAQDLFQLPHEITEEEFDADDGAEKVILTYYESDDIIADINDSVSDYTAEDFGYENLSAFDDFNAKYLKNEKTNTKFKIIYEGTLSYDEATGGVNLNDS